MCQLLTRGISSVAQVVSSSESTSTSGQVGMFYTELGSSNPGSLGIANNYRVPNRIPQGTIPKQAPNQLQYFLK